MTYSELREELLMALYQEQADEGTNDNISFKQLVEDYDLDWRPGWLIAVQRDLQDSGLIDGPSNGFSDDMAIGRLSGPGLRYIEEKYGDKEGVGTLLVKRGFESLLIPASSENRARGVSSALPAGEAALSLHSTYDTVIDGNTHDSKNWTGQRLVLVDSETISRVKEMAIELKSTVYSMRFESNSESANLKGLADALVAVCEMAEPEVTIIDRILASPKFKAYSGLVALVATIRGAVGI